MGGVAYWSALDGTQCVDKQHGMHVCCGGETHLALGQRAPYQLYEQIVQLAEPIIVEFALQIVPIAVGRILPSMARIFKR